MTQAKKESTEPNNSVKSLMEEILDRLNVIESGQALQQNTLDEINDKAEDLQTKFENLEYKLDWPTVQEG